ncbi:MAG TPA: hypothetical protein VMB49_10870 [Acidobacteriaceae bacterium]|nr:hypothetical protein [Acidobacteriaceae bacterium]
MRTQLLHQTAVTASDWQFDPPAEVLESRLFAVGGYLVVRGLFDEETLRDLEREAALARIESQRMLVAESDGTEGRGGFPARAYRSGAGRELHWGLHGCQQMTESLAGVCGLGLAATGCGTYSYYEQSGDFLAVHRDVLQCDIAVITSLTPCLWDRPAGELVVYPDLIREPLSTARAAGRNAGTSIPLDRGHTMILLGGIVPHEVAPTIAGQERIVAINCYRALTAAQPTPDSFGWESSSVSAE